MVSARTLFVLVLVTMLVASEAAPQRFRGRGGRRFNGGRRRSQRPRLINNIGNLLRGGGRSNNGGSNGFNNGGSNNGGSGGFNNGGGSNTQANANVIQGQQGNNGVTQVNANVISQNQNNNPGGVFLSGGVAVASNLQLNGPFGNINLSNAQAQTVNQGFNLFGRRR